MRPEINTPLFLAPASAPLLSTSSAENRPTIADWLLERVWI